MRESIPLTWRKVPERYRMYGTKCLTCGSIYFPIRIFCPKCRRKGKVEKIKLSGRGKIHSFTYIHSPPTGFKDKVPYAMVIVELEDGTKVSGQLVDVKPGEVRIGDTVEPAFRIIQSDDPYGLIHYGFKFRKID